MEAIEKAIMKAIVKPIVITRSQGGCAILLQVHSDCPWDPRRAWLTRVDTTIKQGGEVRQQLSHDVGETAKTVHGRDCGANTWSRAESTSQHENRYSATATLKDSGCRQISRALDTKPRDRRIESSYE